MCADADSSKDVAREGKPPARELKGLPLVFFDNFDADPGERWEQSDPKAWKSAEQNGNRVYSQFQHIEVKTPVRSPFNRALVKDLVVGDLVLDVRLQSTIKDYDHRDMCLFFGGVDESHLFYVHLGKVPDPNCHNVFIVDGAPRKNIATKVSEGAPWDDNYHTVKVSRDAEGNIKVFWEGQQIMTAKNDKFPAGKLGVGTFDDIGNFASITVWGKKAE